LVDTAVKSNRIESNQIVHDDTLDVAVAVAVTVTVTILLEEKYWQPRSADPLSLLFLFVSMSNIYIYIYK